MVDDTVIEVGKCLISTQGLLNVLAMNEKKIQKFVMNKMKQRKYKRETQQPTTDVHSEPIVLS
jgi:hypothetical protein